MFRRLIAATLAASALFGLTACTGSPAAPITAPTSQSSDQPGDEGQSKADACALIQQSIEDAAGEFDSIPTSDPAAVVEAMRSAAAELSDTASRITNDEVAALVPALQDMFSQVAEVMDAIVQGDASQVDELSQLGEEFRATSEAFQEVCAP
jgi:hypothetical protein